MISRRSPFLCRRFWLRLPAVFLGVLLVAGPWVLPLGNPNWHALIYRFQWQCWPGARPQMPSDFTGTWTVYRPDGSNYFAAAFVEGKRHGHSLGWHENGTLQFERHYRDDRKHGRWRHWRPNGLLASEGWYEDGCQDGWFMHWGEDGRPRERLHFRDGLAYGCHTIWNPDGGIERKRWNFDGFPVTRDEFDLFTIKPRQAVKLTP